MCSIIRLGAFKHDTNEYIHPSLANKTDKYVCPNCNKDVMFKKGLIKIPHFAHYKDNDNKLSELTFSWVVLLGSATITSYLDNAVLAVTAVGSIQVQVTITDVFGNFTSLTKTFVV
jgi:hypothetical protein